MEVQSCTIKTKANFRAAKVAWSEGGGPSRPPPTHQDERGGRSTPGVGDSQPALVGGTPPTHPVGVGGRPPSGKTPSDNAEEEALEGKKVRDSAVRGQGAF